MTQGFDEWFKRETGNSKWMQEIESWCDKVYEAGQQSRQAEIDELQKRIDEALIEIESKSENSWRLWKEKADMYEQGASNAYENAYWILKGKEDE